MIASLETVPEVSRNEFGGPLPSRFEKLNKMLLDNSPSSVLLIDPQTRIVLANQNFLQKSRLRESQVIGKLLEAVFPPVIYQDMKFRSQVAEAFLTGEAIKGRRLTYRTPGLPTRTYYYSLIPFRGEGKIEYVMLLMEDVTDKIRLGEEARRAERHLASVVESASDVVISMDVTGRVLTWNTAASRITGYEESEVRNRNLCDLCAGEQSAGLAQVLERVSSQGQMGPVEVELVSRDGTRVPIAWICSPMRDAEGRVVGLVAVGRDLTERRQFQAQLLRSEKLAALGVMAGGIAHEIRNPLAVVSSAAQILLEIPTTEELRRECAEKIHRSVQRIAVIIESLLRFARPSDKGVMKPLNLVQVIQDALAFVGNQMKLARIDLRACCPGHPVPVQGNPGLLQQLVTNLLLNAANAMPESGGVIELAVQIQKDQAVLGVADNGRGIPREDLAKVFDPFFTTMPVGKGTGLGLSISYAIVQQHEGKIDIASECGRGTTVTVVLPIHRPDTPP